MSTPVSQKQATKFVVDALGDPDGDQMQYLLANSKFFKKLAHADFSRIDFDAFTRSLTSALAPIAWNPVSGYATKISEWNKLRGWGLTRGQIDTFANTLVDHLDLLHPTGISLWLGRDLSFNWEEVTACLKLEVEALGKKFGLYIESDRLSFFPGSEQSGKPRLDVALLDIQTYVGTTSGVVPSEIRKIKKRLPGLEVAWLLALNPQVYLAIDYKTIPGFIAAGLVVDSVFVSYFAYDSGAYVGVLWADAPRLADAVMIFRENK